MPELLEDLAEETTASQRRIAERVAEESQRLEDFHRQLTSLLDFRQMVVESAQQATDHVISRLPQAEGIWRLALSALRANPLREDAERLLNRVLTVFESCQELLSSPNNLWKLAVNLGAESDRREELERARKRLGDLIAETRRSLEHRRQGWNPADPERLALGLQMSREGKTVTADEARARFPRTTD